MPKGMCRILFERGYNSDLVKTARLSRYSKSGKKEEVDEKGKIKEEFKKYSLTYLLSQCVDFNTEKTDLEALCIQLGTNVGIKSTILYTPKFHCKLAGEGI